MSRGSSFDSFLKEEGIYEEVVRQTVKKVFAEKIRQGMKARKVAQRMSPKTAAARVQPL
jgi:hypothetical protein